MSEIIAFMPTYSPDTEAVIAGLRPYIRATNQEIVARALDGVVRPKPSVYFDAIDSVLNTRPDIKLVVADGKSTESMRQELTKHHFANDAKYDIMLYAEKKSQWWIFNDIIEKYATSDTKYFVYTSSDVIWHMDWVGEAIREFERNPKLQILFPCVSRGDLNLPCQVAAGARDLDLIAPPHQSHARAPCLNAYVMIFRMDFLQTYGGYPDIFRNCFTESFLHYMCEAMGGQMRLMPRGHVLHYGEGDKWETPGSAYFYTEEALMFQTVMNGVLMHKALGRMTVPYLKETLYKKEK